MTNHISHTIDRFEVNKVEGKQLNYEMKVAEALISDSLGVLLTWKNALPYSEQHLLGFLDMTVFYIRKRHQVDCLSKFLTFSVITPHFTSMPADTICNRQASHKGKKPHIKPINVYVVLSEDTHLSEYIARCDEYRAFISGFNGSWGIADNKALLRTEGRYCQQATMQMDDNNWTSLTGGSPDAPKLGEFSQT
nr:unnamed protein product [Callosobruchus analis]